MNHVMFGILLAGTALPALAQSTDAPAPAPIPDPHVRVHIDCKTTTGTCATAPKPPAPPPPPARSARPAIPPIPAIPAPPPPPPAPKVPPVPAQAHAACAGKTPGSTLTWELAQGEVMRGTCAGRDGKMTFVLREYELNG